MAKRTNTAVWIEKYNRWQINVQKDGKRKSFSSYKPGRVGQREANAKADAWLDDGILGESFKVSQLYDEYFETIKATTSISNWKKIESIGANWIKPSVGHLKISTLTERHLQEIINKAYTKGLAKKTLNNIRATITSFVKFCRISKATTLMPESLSIPRGATKVEKQILQPTDLIRLFTSSETVYRGKIVHDPLIHAYRFQVLTGLRPGELLGLEWSDISNGVVNIQRSYNGFGEVTSGKNENARRRFALTPSAIIELESQRKLSDTDRVFGELSQSTYWKHWRRYCEHNGITPVSPYELRHTFVSIAKGLTEGQLKALVGHSQNMDTYGIYSHEVEGELIKTAASLDQIFSSILKSED